MKTPGTYIIRGGAEGKKRLEVLARVIQVAKGAKYDPKLVPDLPEKK
jgi:hypothetical protein